MKTRIFPLLTALPRGFIIGLEIMAVLAVMLAGALTFLLYRVAQGPVDLEFVRPYIEEALSSRGHQVDVQVERASLSWPNLSGALKLDLKNLIVTNNRQPVVQVRDLSLALAKAPLLIGRIRPERLIVRRPVLNFERDLENHLHFSLQGPFQSASVSTTSPEEMTRGVLAMMFGNRTVDYGIFSRVDEVSIEDAELRIADATQGMTWRLRNTDLSFRAVDVGVYGSINVRLPNQQHFSLVLTYNRARDDLNVSSQFRDFALTTFVGRLAGIDVLRHQQLPLTGSFELKGRLRDFTLDRLVLNANSNKGSFDTQGLIGEDLPITGARLNLNYDRAQAKWNLDEFAFNLLDIPVRADGVLAPTSDQSYRGQIHLRVDRLTLARVNELWPPRLRELPLARWLTQKLSGATVKDIDVLLPIWVGRKDRQLTFLALKPVVSFDFENLRADYHPPLYPVEQASGNGTFQNDKLAIAVKRGKIRDLDLKDTTLVIHDVTVAGKGEAEIDLRMKGPVSTVLEYIALDPINLGKKIPIKPADVEGNGVYRASISFPTLHDLPADLVEVDVKARLNDVVFPGLVRGQTLSGGPYDLEVQDGILNLTGVGQIAGRAIALDFMQPIHSEGQKILMQVQAQVDSGDDLRRAFGADLPFIQGAAPVKIDYLEHADGRETISIDTDLTPTRVSFDALRYNKVPGVSASARLNLNLKNRVLVDARGFEVIGPDLMIKNGRLVFGMVDQHVNLTRGEFPNVVLGRTKAGVIYTRAAGRMGLEIQGDRLDLSPFLSGKTDPEVGPVLTLKANVKSLGLSGSDEMKDVHLAVDLNARADLERLDLSGTVGRGPVTVRYLPNTEGRMVLDLIAQDAGSFLRTMGIYENMIGGVLSIHGSPIGDNNRDVKGDLLIKDFAVVKAPVLAQLLGSLSIEGVGEQLSNKGLTFTRLESGFAWLRRPRFDLMSFREGRTSGSALGLTFDGLYDRRKSTIEVTGTIIPVSGLNTFTSKIPLVGQLLTGGRGNALFAATYSIKGPANEPKTMINPLSVLTPGILRKIFFENSPRDPLKGSRTSIPPSVRGYN